MAANGVDVVILGAGMAGLAAARRLTAAGRHVVLVEARDRIGGRVHSLREPGWPVPVEAGAEFIHGTPRETWEIVRAAGLLTYEVVDQHWDATAGPPRPLDFGPFWVRLFERIEQLDGTDLPFADFLERYGQDLTPTERQEVTAYVEGFNAADARRISTRWIHETEEALGEGETGSFRILDGYDRVAGWLQAVAPADSLDLRLGTVATALRWQRGHVEVETGAASIRADRAVITLPLGVLQAPAGTRGSVRFVPELADKRAVWERLRMGGVVKIVLRFREAPWQAVGLGDLAFLHTLRHPFLTWWTTRPLHTPILTGWAGGPAAGVLAGLDGPAVLDRALATLADAFGLNRRRLEEQLQAWHVFDWQADPFSRGAYSYVPVHEVNTPARLAAPVEDTLFFAGEATHPLLSGTVAGALASGYRAADEVLHSTTG